MALALRVAVKRSFPSAAAARCARRFATSADSAAGTAVPSDAEVAEAWEERKPPKKFVRYDAMDPFNFDSQLTEDEVMIRDGVRDFCQDSLLPRVQEGFRDEEFDRTMFPEMGQMGMLGSTITGYGCPGISSVGYGLIAREVERVDSGYRSAMSVQSSLVMGPIYEHGTPELCAQFLPGLAAGELVGAFGLTEPGAGSDPAGMLTHAVKDGDDWLISGSKTWISNSPIADVFIVWAKDPAGDIRGFVLERGMPGLTTPVIEGKFSLRASVTGMIMMDKVRVPAASGGEPVVHIGVSGAQSSSDPVLLTVADRGPSPSDYFSAAALERMRAVSRPDAADKLEANLAKRERNLHADTSGDFKRRGGIVFTELRQPRRGVREVPRVWVSEPTAQGEPTAHAREATDEERRRAVLRVTGPNLQPRLKRNL